NRYEGAAIFGVTFVIVLCSDRLIRPINVSMHFEYRRIATRSSSSQLRDCAFDIDDLPLLPKRVLEEFVVVGGPVSPDRKLGQQFMVCCGVIVGRKSLNHFFVAFVPVLTTPIHMDLGARDQVAFKIDMETEFGGEGPQQCPPVHVPRWNGQTCACKG